MNFTDDIHKAHADIDSALAAGHITEAEARADHLLIDVFEDAR